MREHTQDWEKACEEMGIKITAGAALEYLNKIERTVERDIPPYSKEAFANALAEFIMADDLVSSNYFSLLCFSRRIINSVHKYCGITTAEDGFLPPQEGVKG